MWRDYQNLNKPRIDVTGKRWNFRVWHDVIDGRHIERLFYWDDTREYTGVVLLSPALHVSRLHTLIQKLVSDSEMREKHKRVLCFPLERHYSDYPAFPEENTN